MFPKRSLDREGTATLWQLIGWTRSKSRTIYTDLKFELLAWPRVKRTFCFPQEDLHCLPAITFEGQGLLVPNGVLRCQHLQDAGFWEHEDPCIFHSASTSDVEPFLHKSHDPNRTETQHTRAKEQLPSNESDFRPSNLFNDQSCLPYASRSLARLKSKSCSAIRSPATDSKEPFP